MARWCYRQRVITTAEAAGGGQLEVALGGQDIEQAESQGSSSSTGAGIIFALIVLNRRGAVIGREMVPAGEAGHVGDVADRCDSGGGPARDFWFWHRRSPRGLGRHACPGAASAW
jgi:hypothetical protein